MDGWMDLYLDPYKVRTNWYEVRTKYHKVRTKYHKVRTKYYKVRTKWCEVRNRPAGAVSTDASSNEKSEPSDGCRPLSAPAALHACTAVAYAAVMFACIAATNASFASDWLLNLLSAARRADCRAKASHGRAPR